MIVFEDKSGHEGREQIWRNAALVCSTWTVFRVCIGDLVAGLSACGHAVCPHTELLTFDLLLGQPVTCLHSVRRMSEWFAFLSEDGHGS